MISRGHIVRGFAGFAAASAAFGTSVGSCCIMFPCALVFAGVVERAGSSRVIAGLEGCDNSGLALCRDSTEQELPRQVGTPSLGSSH